MECIDSSQLNTHEHSKQTVVVESSVRHRAEYHNISVTPVIMEDCEPRPTHVMMMVVI